MEDYILREINRIGELIAALMAKIGLMRQSASPEQIRTTAKTELAEKLDIDIDTLLDEADFIGRLTDEYGFGDQELDKFAELLFDMVAASEQHAERLRLAAAVGAIYSYLDAKKAPLFSSFLCQFSSDFSEKETDARQKNHGCKHRTVK